MKHVANMISLSRIVLVIALFCSFHNAPLFATIYLACGLSDALDGYIARKTKTESELGARLDSIADLLLFGVIAAAIVAWLGDEALAFLPWVLVVVLIRCANLFIAARKYHVFASLHTWGNKLAGFLLFIAPLFVLYQQTGFLWVVCVAAILSAAEETAIHIISPVLQVNRRSIFKV